MTLDQIDRLVAGLPGKSTLIETHISWVILGIDFVYKIRKPMRYAFLDFSTVEMRRLDCEKELTLNQRTSPQVYIQVVPILEAGEQIYIGSGGGKVIDHAVQMVRLDNERQMDVLLKRGLVTTEDVEALAVYLSNFHSRSPIIDAGPTAHGLWLDLADILKVESLTYDVLGPEAADRLRHIVSQSKVLLDSLQDRIYERHALGFTRDVHGDLHTRNIFLMPEPVLFDCLEFNDHLRQIDLLNELAFLGMDLESYGRSDLWQEFLLKYQLRLPVVLVPKDKVLLKYYLGYRANIRYKVAALRVVQDCNTLNIKELKKLFLNMTDYFEDA